ncbi:family 65 glycosyl hydrolase [Nocardiopsis gilva YIM 90087]|uniref:Family 65 glycosyl hydrolase n=1 Tax=Nocardiopsis gilva YIM 90087 TaxID=1235441 RepID=A0A223S6Z3_9ACTN|nr:glycosyl hydrolase family 65 protein [Nocardiopsis gilva]ASU83883.1 family 65 glycosyl hydrolase [Nocardiopsis gilva YIM 90087]
MSVWELTYDDLGPEHAGVREALCTLGNGCFAPRGATPEPHADASRRPGTYIAGCYNRLTSAVADHEVENEDLVNAPDWLPLTFRAEDGAWFTTEDAVDQRQELDMRRGVLTRTCRVRDHAGRVTRLTQRRLVSMADPRIAALETTLVPENWSGRLTVRSALDACVRNEGVPRYAMLRGDHLRPLDTGYDRSGPGDACRIWLRAETCTSEVRIALAARTTMVPESPDSVVGERPAVCTSDGWIACEPRVDIAEGQGATVEKVVALCTSRDPAISDCLTAAREAVGRVGSFDEVLRRHTAAWERIWRSCAVDIGGGEGQLALNLHVFHLLQSVSPHSADLDVGVPARGLHGEAYRGHVFWDELFVFPFLDLHFPQTARSLLRYRWRRLPQARAAARAAGLRGALFPWQSGSDGREETQRLHLNPQSGRWLPDHSRLQRHVGIAIAYNVWQHYQVTGDRAFLADFGAELLLEIARMLASLTVFDEEMGRYRIRGVMGPDEYHDGMPGREEPGLDDNAYTNIMTVWVLLRALDVVAALPQWRSRELRDALELTPEELAEFRRITERMRVVFHDGVISQFDGYADLAELDWEGYRATYGDIRRLDRILEAEGDTCNRYRASKQADVLMLFFLLPPDEFASILRRLGYACDPGLIGRTIDYYLARTSHGSTLSSVVHAWVLAHTDRESSWRFFLEALRSDIEDVQGGTTAEGIHLGAMAGTVDILTRCYTGLAAAEGVLRLDPLLPSELDRLTFRIRYRGHWGIEVAVREDQVAITVPSSEEPPIDVELAGRRFTIHPGTRRVFGPHRAREEPAGA